MSCPIHGVQGPKRNIVVAQLAEAFLKEHPEKRRPKDDTDRLDQLSAKLLDGLKKDEVPAPNRQQTNLRPTPTTHNQQPTTNNQQPTTNNQQPTKPQQKADQKIPPSSLSPSRWLGGLFLFMYARPWSGVLRCPRLKSVLINPLCLPAPCCIPPSAHSHTPLRLTGHGRRGGRGRR